MAKLTASTFIGTGSLWLFLDNNLILRNNDSVTVELETDNEYIVHWFAKGVPGSSYSITISSPREAEYQLTKTVVTFGKDQGAFRFKA